MKQIKLTTGQIALISDIDYDKVIKYRWYAYWCESCKTFYVKRVERPQIRLHRFILNLNIGDGIVVDHRDHNGLNNQRNNTIAGTSQANSLNRLNVKGFRHHKGENKYWARIKISGKIIELGGFDSDWEAHLAYLAAKTSYIKTLQQK